MFWCRRLRRPPSDAVPVLHRAGVLREVVVLGDGHVDDLVGVDERRVDRPLVEHVALQAHRAEAVLGGEDRPRRRASYAARQMPERWKQRFGSLHEASVTTTRLAPASNASCTTVADDVGVRVRGVDRHAIPADVRLDDDDVAARDEALHPAERVDRAPRQGRVRRSGSWRSPAREARARRRLQAKVAHLPNAFGAVDVDAPVIPAPSAPGRPRPRTSGRLPRDAEGPHVERVDQPFRTLVCTVERPTPATKRP